MAQFRNSAVSYGMVAQAFHWVVAALVLAQLALGVYAANLPVSLSRLQWLSRHKAIGLGILALVLLRLAWRWLDPPPQPPGALPRWERALSGVGHGLLYALLVAAPLTGWLHASAAGLGGGGFGLFLVPDLVPKDPSLAAVFQEMHLWLTTLLAALLALHIGAALHHALVRRDGVMRRMLP